MVAASLCPSCSAPLNGIRCAGCGAAARAGAFRVLGVLAESPHGRTYRAEGPTGVVALKELVFALVPTATGCVHLEGATLDRLWVEQADGGRRQLQVRAAFSTRKDGTEPCRQQAQLVLFDSRSKTAATVKLDPEGRASFTLPLPQGQDRLRVAFGHSSRAAAILRIDLQRGTAEQEALALTP